MEFVKIVPNLMVEDVSLTLNFYHGVLGFETVSTLQGDDDVIKEAKIKKGDVEITFQNEKSFKKEIPEISSEEPGGGLTLVIQVTEIDDFYNKIFTSIDLAVELRQSRDGSMEFTIIDVNGYYLTFVQIQS